MRDHPNVIHSLVLGGQVASSIVVQRPANQANESKLVNQSIGLLQFRPSLSGCSLRDHAQGGAGRFSRSHRPSTPALSKLYPLRSSRRTRTPTDRCPALVLPYPTTAQLLLADFPNPPCLACAPARWISAFRVPAGF